ncbi:dihydrofolate reductase family protein [Halococcus hamelinensis]|uniref:Deaminase-reductase domain-containing protein n=1 Tax=Halococcus hamelinensis 100A6 TaxID=1132509 RepID=M0M036_9EURY|nr:dihydrofolate reductase family protein [Halococcus hamelinensis]EMA37745.1 deaminase-reductase domain-containing protein [Halococcus hamelinensis 100A6]
MANLTYAINSSLDGYIADENGNFDWSEPSEDAHTFFNDLQGSVGTSLLGRRMYETMRAWDTFDHADLPKVQRGFAEAWRATDKVVYSTTLDAVPESRTRLERTFDPKVVEAMKDQADHDLSISGPGLATEAIRAGLVDRYVLRILPTIVGGGTRALPDAAQVDLTLNTTLRFDDGSVLVDYSLQ